MIIDTIKDASLNARNEKDASAALLVTLLSEVEKVGKDNGNRRTTNAEATMVIKKFISNAQQIINLAGENTDAAAKAQNEINILEQYLPKQMTQEEITTAIIAVLNENKSATMGDVMKALKEYHEGRYDGKLASKLAGGILAGRK